MTGRTKTLRVWAVAIFVATGCLATSAWQLQSSRNAYLDAARHLALSLAHAAANRLAASTQALDGLLADTVALRPDPAHPNTAAQPELSGRLSTFAEIEQLILIDAAGQARVTIRPDGMVRPLVQDMQQQPFFAHQVETWRDGKLFLGTPVFDRAGARPTVYLSRPLISLDGQFMGVAAIKTRLDFIDKALASVIPEEGSASGVFSPNGILYSRQPADERFVGRSLADSQTFRAYAAIGGAGTATQGATSFSDGTSRILGFTPVPDYPLVSMVGIGRDHVLENWWREVWVHGSVQFLLIVVILSMTGLLVRSERRNADITNLLLSRERAHIAQLEQAVSDRTSQLNETLNALTDSEHRFRLIVEIAPLPLMLVRHDGGAIAFLNNRAAETLGLENEHGILPPLAVFFPTDSDYKELIRLIDHDGCILSHELTMTRISGERFSALISIARISLNGEDLLLTGLQDITGLKHLEEELARSNRDLEQFSYAVSHDLQEPLRMVSSYLGLLERRYGPSLDETAHEFIGYAVDGAKRMSRMITALLDYSRVHRRGNPFQPVALDQVLADAQVNLSSAITISGATIRTGDLPRVEGDPSQLMRVFQNLIGNAIKYRIADHRPQITVTATVQDDLCTICITDDGIGIDPSHAGRLFQVFQRLHPRDSYECDGVGLAVCRRIIERHGGTIWMTSDGAGTGTTFSFTLPVLSGDFCPLPQPDGD